jgi:DegT/DnrJ/EryC1/StrS aminotransferase family
MRSRGFVLRNFGQCTSECGLAGPWQRCPVHYATFIASVLAAVHAGAIPVFCDVEPDTGLMDAASAQAVITERTAAIIPVHLYGQACNKDAIAALSRRHGLFVLEDAAQAHGASWRGERVGGLGDAAAFSFYPSKNLGALGEGGAVCTGDPELAESVSELRNIGRRRDGEHVRSGYNERQRHRHRQDQARSVVDGQQAPQEPVPSPVPASHQRPRQRRLGLGTARLAPGIERCHLGFLDQGGDVRHRQGSAS